MSEILKAALVIAVSILVAAYINSYFSPYSTYVRNFANHPYVKSDKAEKEVIATMDCAKWLSGKNNCLQIPPCAVSAGLIFVRLLGIGKVASLV